MNADDAEGGSKEFGECVKKLSKYLDKEASPSVLDEASLLIQELEGHVSALVSRPSVSPITQLTVVKKVLWFCRQGEVTRSGLFEALGLRLTSLFRATYGLLKSCLDNTLSEQSLVQCKVTTLLTEITAVAALSLYFDPSLLALCWCSVGKLSCGSSTSLGSATSPDAVLPHVISELCGALVAITKQSTLEGDPLLEKRLKSSRLLCSVLVRLLSRFPGLEEECGKLVVDMLLATHQATHAVSNATLRSKLESSLLLLHEPLIQCMSSSLRFVGLLLEDSGVSSGQHYGWALSLTALLKHCSSLPDGVLRYCWEAGSCRDETFVSCRVLDCILTCFEKCQQELSVSSPVAPVVCNGEPQSTVSLYEWVCCHVCVALSYLPNDLLQHVEAYLVSRLLTSCAFSAVLAADCLTFMARLGGETMLANYCKFLMDVLESFVGSCSHAHPVLVLGGLLNRLLASLPAQAQISILSAGGVSHRSVLWCHVQPHSLHTDTVTALQHLVSNAISCISESSRSFEDIGCMLHCLCALWQGISDAQVATLGKVLLQIWRSPSMYSHEVSLSLSCLLLPLMCKDEVLVCFSELPSSQHSLSLTLATCRVLGCSAALHSIQESSIERSFSSLLCVGHWLVRHHVLESFRAFAEVACHAGAVEACVPPALTNTVIDFLCKIPYGDSMYQARLDHCAALSQPHHTLATLKVSSDASDVIMELENSWKCVQGLKEELSNAFLNQLATINASISSFLAEH